MSLRIQPKARPRTLLMATAGLAATGVGPSQVLQWQNDIPLDRPILGFDIEFAGRAGVTAACGAVAVDAICNIIQNVTVQGIHKKLGNRTVVSLSGRELFRLAQKYQQGTTPYNLSSTTALPAVGAALAIANYDLRVVLPVSVVPQGIPKAQQMGYAIREDEWDSLDVSVTLGDITALAAVAGGQAMTFTAWGGAAGVPTLRLTPKYAIFGSARSQVVPALYRATSLPLTGILTAATFADQVIQDLTAGYKVHSYLVSVGTAQAATAGVIAYSAMIDTAITRLGLSLNGVREKDFPTPFGARQHTLENFGALLPAGYMPLEFVEGHDINTVFHGDALSRSDKWQLFGDVTAAATQQGSIIEELLEGSPVFLDEGGAEVKK